ncbi:hypothetical protein HW537_00410 [Asaia siamensis]
MSSVQKTDRGISLALSDDEALVLFEWLSRNWEKNQWGDDRPFADQAQRSLLVDIENGLASMLAAPFSSDYEEALSAAYKLINR